MDKLFLGVLSGTSLDAIDVGAFSFTATTALLHYSLNYPIPADIKQACLNLSETNHCDIEQLGVLDHKLGVLFAAAINTLLQQHKLAPSAIAAIGSHGQNIKHKPTGPYPFTMQIGDPNIIAAKTGVMTIADFRRKDLALGGQGAPLAPGFHSAIFRSAQENRVILNIGGISNVSILPSDFTIDITGYDIGPGNCLMDAWTLQHFNLPYDADGKLAATGAPIIALLNSMLADPYFKLAPPKSTGREYFNLAWLERHLAQLTTPYSATDVLATLLQLSSETISHAIKERGLRTEIYICGGGAYNSALLAALTKNLGQKPRLTTTLGIAPEWVEAGLFAWLARQCLLGLPGNIPAVTGADQAAVLGGVYV